MLKRNVVWFAALLLMIFSMFTCQPQEEQEPMGEMQGEMQAEEITRAVAVLHPTEGHEVTGTVWFTKTENGIKVVADVEGLTPGMHGFHIHQLGDCTAPDGTSAGGHFAPDGSPHGAPDDPADQRHVGDLGNIQADQDGVAYLEWTDPLISFSGGHSIIGRAVIVHAGEDDLESQPTGDAGARVACGVIGIAKGKGEYSM